MSLHFCRAQNLRVLFSEQHLPPETHPIIENFEQKYKINIQPSIIQHGSSNPEDSERINYRKGSSKEERMPKQEYEALRQLISNIEPTEGWTAPNMIRHVQGVERYGQRFQPASVHSNNAHVMFQLSAEEAPSPGVIQSLFTHKRWTTRQDEETQTFALVQEYEQLADEHIQHDLYRTFPLAGGQLCYKHLRKRQTIIPFSSVITHAGHTPVHIGEIDEELLHILPL